MVTKDFIVDRQLTNSMKKSSRFKWCFSRCTWIGWSC